jgi:hypothetical protein
MNVQSCPSEAILDAFELAEPVPPATRTHIESCPQCAARLRERKEAFAAIDRAAMVRAIHVAVTAAEGKRRPSRWMRVLPALALAGGAAVAAILFVRPPVNLNGLREKGSIGLDVFVERGGIVRKAAAGTEFHPGDRLRFEVDLSRPAHVMIVGQEADGALYNGFPATASVATSMNLPSGPDQLLPGAVELDEKLGREVLHLVACDRAFESREIRNEGGVLVLPNGCVEAPFVLKKVD